MSALNIAVVGAGIIGRTHIRSLSKVDGLRLAAIVDPASGSADLAAEEGADFHADIDGLLGRNRPDGVIVASPNHTHVAIATAFLEAGIPVLLEKPLASDALDARDLLATVERTGMPLLLGHHRRHNPIIKTAKAAIAEGRIGDLVTAVVMSTLTKPDDYFDADWRRMPGQGGPININMSHEIDLLRHFFGEVTTARAVISNARRGLEVEDTASAILTFEKGGIASLTVTDAACGPWAWDVSAGEAPDRFPAHDIYAHVYSGSRAGLSLPDLVCWTHPGRPDWTTEMNRKPLDYQPADVYREQLLHFEDIIRIGTAPLVTCADGLANMQIIAAIRKSAAEDRTVEVER